MFSTETQEHVSRKPITNDIFLSFLTALYMYINHYINGYVLKTKEVLWPRTKTTTMAKAKDESQAKVTITNVTAKPWLKDM